MATFAALWWGVAQSPSGAINALAQWADADLTPYIVPAHAWVQDPSHAVAVATVGYLLLALGATGLVVQPVSNYILRFRSAPSLLVGLTLIAEVGAPLRWDRAIYVAVVLIVGTVVKVRRGGFDALGFVALEISFAAVYVPMMLVAWACSATRTPHVPAAQSLGERRTPQPPHAVSMVPTRALHPE